MAEEELDLKIVYLSSNRAADVFPNIREDATDTEIYDTARAFLSLRDLSGTSGYDILKVVSKELYTSE